MKTVLAFLARLRPADLILPAGAALVSAGLQNLVDREHRQRQRLAALDELVDMHRAGLRAAGVDLSSPVWGDETHPLDIEGAIGIILARTPTEPKREETDAGDSRSADYGIAGNRNPAIRRRRLTRAGLVLAAAGAIGVTALRPGGFLSALSLSGLKPTGGWPGPVDDDAPPAADHPFEPIVSVDYPAEDRWGGDRCTTCERAAAWFRDEQAWHHVDPGTAAPYPMLHEVTLPPSENYSSTAPAARDGVDVDQAVDRDAAAAVEGVIGRGVPPMESCGWPGCDWSSDATRSELSQRTAAAVHRNRCIYRPAGAQVAE